MTVNRWLRLIAGAFVLTSVLVGHFVSPWAYLLAAFVAGNLVQSAFTNACPMMTLLRRLDVPDDTRLTPRARPPA